MLQFDKGASFAILPQPVEPSPNGLLLGVDLFFFFFLVRSILLLIKRKMYNQG